MKRFWEWLTLPNHASGLKVILTVVGALGMAGGSVYAWHSSQEEKREAVIRITNGMSAIAAQELEFGNKLIAKLKSGAKADKPTAWVPPFEKKAESYVLDIDKAFGSNSEEGKTLNAQAAALQYGAENLKRMAGTNDISEVEEMMAAVKKRFRDAGLNASPGGQIRQVTESAPVASMFVGQPLLPLTQVAGPASCKFSLEATARSIPAIGGSFSAKLFASDQSCAWTAQSNVQFVTNVSPTSGSGDGVISFTVAKYTFDSPRSGTLSVADQLLTVSQYGQVFGCMDPTASNYNALAVSSTGVTCTYRP